MNKMTRSTLFGLSIATATLSPVGSAAEPQDTLMRMVTCQDSWYDWKDDESRMDAFAATLEAHFREGQSRGVLVPSRPATLMDFEIVETTPASLGIGIGFAVTVKGPASEVRRKYEAALGRKLSACQQDEGLSVCSENIASEKSAMLMTPTRRPEVGTLVGCFYRSQR